MEALEKIASELENSKNKDGYTLMEHLTAMMERLVESPNEYPIEKIEELSYFIKTSLTEGLCQTLQPSPRISFQAVLVFLVLPFLSLSLCTL